MRFRPLHTIFSMTLLALFFASTSSWAVDTINEDLVITPTIGTESATFNMTSLSGDTVIFGSEWQAHTEGLIGEQVSVDSGAVYIYDRDGASWTYSDMLMPEGIDMAGIHYGKACAIDGDTIVVGAPNYSIDGQTLGAIYIYDRVGSSWSESAMITCPTGEVNSLFGGNLAIDGDNLIVGATKASATIGGSTYSDGGKAFIFSRNEGGSDNWGLVSTLTGSATMANAQFGKGVDIEGDLITVGAYLDSAVNPNPDPETGEPANLYSVGQAYVFEYSDSVWNEVTTLERDLVGNAKFGVSTSIDGDYIVVGASEDDDAGVNAGAVYIYGRDEGGTDAWGQVTKLTASDATDFSLFGSSCVMDDGKIIVGAYRAVDVFGDVDGEIVELESDKGAIYAFEEDSFGFWSETALFLASDGADRDMLGYSVDLQGNELVATALRGDGSSSDTGEAYFFTVDGSIEPPKVPGDANGDGKVDGSDVTILANNWQAGVPNGSSSVVWSMGDFNGDGKVDGSDVTILASNWQYGVTTAAATVPEPSTILLIFSAIIGVVLIRRRNR